VNERIEIILGRLVAALERRDSNAAIAATRKLRAFGFSNTHIIFLVFLYRKFTARLDGQEVSTTETERSSRVKAILWSGLYAVPTIIGAVILQWMTLTFGYLVIVQVERWFGGVILGALSGLAVGDYRVWLEGKREAKRLQATRAYIFWKRQKLLRKLRYLVYPSTLTVDLKAFEVKKKVAANTIKRSQLLQGYLVLRFSESGWTQFWEGVNFERGTLIPRKVFVAIAIGFALFAAVDSISAGVMVGFVCYFLMVRIMPFLNVGIIYFPTLLRGVDPGQSANASAALRVMTTMTLIGICLGIDIVLTKFFGLPKVGLLNLF
jgi:hypothetical protein